jgi:hypothetical protein
LIRNEPFTDRLLVAAGALSLTDAGAFFQSGVREYFTSASTLPSHEDCSCQPDWIINLPPETRMDRWPEPSSH